MRGAGAQEGGVVRDKRGWHVGVVVALVVAVLGMLAGVRGTGREASAQLAPRAAAIEPVGQRALSYTELRAGTRSPNQALAPTWWRSLPSPDLFAPVVQSASDREAAVARRAARRAYDGAPPTVPHPVEQLGVPGCLTCHERGAKIAEHVAPKMSHAPMGSCVQCHVPAEDPRVTAAGAAESVAPWALPQQVVADNGFAGRGPPGPGERAWPGAPPVIPHTTWMRERCDGCHGVFGASGMRSTHPWRQSCTQCHAPAAELDQRPVWAQAAVTP